MLNSLNLASTWSIPWFEMHSGEPILARREETRSIAGKDDALWH